MSKRLRYQEVTVKPRILVRPGGFDVEHLGKATGNKCVMPCQTLDEAVGYAYVVASRYPDEVREINVRRAQARHISRAARLGSPVAA